MDATGSGGFGGDDVASRLSERQRECLSMVADGYSSKEIGRALNLAPSTVDNHLQSALARLGATSRMQAARMLRSDRATAEQDRPTVRPWLPPLGGAVNEAGLRRRYLHVVQVALLGTMALAAITITIAGIVGLFNR